jgi:osmotically-inducible protein OsmY
MTTITDPATSMNELHLKDAVVDELNWAPGVDSAHVGVSVSGGAVRLSGEVDSYPEKLLAAKAAQRVRGVTALAQEITVRSPETPITDTDIARTAGDALRQAVDVPDTVHTSVHDHVVTLTGEASNYGHRAALRAVAYLTGVQDVNDCISLQAGPALVVTATKEAIAEAIGRNARIASHIDVTCDPTGVITLTGTVDSFDARHQANHAAWAAPGVTGVIDRMTIREWIPGAAIGRQSRFALNDDFGPVAETPLL